MKNNKHIPFSNEFKSGLWIALLEYLLIVLPVLIYVCIESIIKGSYLILFETPEWSIATIFLSFIGLNKYRIACQKSAAFILNERIVLIGLLGVVFTVAAVVNLVLSMKGESIEAIVWRLVLLFCATLEFFFLMIGTKYIEIRRNEN